MAVGKISGAVGLRGEVKLVRWADSLERFGLLKKVRVGSDEHSHKEFDVENARTAGAGIVLKFAGVEDRSSAEGLAGLLVMIPADDIVQPAKGSFFIDDVLGMKVLTEEGKEVGVVREVLRLPSNDLWQVETKSGTILIPAVKEFIRKVDVVSKTVVIHEIEGLLEP